MFVKARVDAHPVDLGTLRARLRGRRFSEDAARYLGHAVASALADAHEAFDAEGNPAPVIHGRLRPEVVRIDRDGAVWIDGLGERENAAEASVDEGWPAPELRAGGRMTARVDVYALGVLLRELGVASGGELGEAIAKATEERPGRRRITCFEVAAWLAHGCDLAAGRRALARMVEAGERAPVEMAGGRPLSVPARIGVAAITAAVVFAGGVLAIERARAGTVGVRSDTMRP
ncbi:MAG: hypothetical protein QM820_14605 [Minicystis sp.]